MTEYRIRRTGKRPLRFTGEVVAKATSAGHPGLQDRSHTITLYFTEGGRWVLAMFYDTNWGSERPWHRGAYHDDRDSVLEALDDWDPCDDINLPPGAKYDALQDEVEKAVSDGWAIAVSDLLEQVREMDEIIA